MLELYREHFSVSHPLCRLLMNITLHRLLCLPISGRFTTLDLSLSLEVVSSVPLWLKFAKDTFLSYFS